MFRAYYRNDSDVRTASFLHFSLFFDTCKQPSPRCYSSGTVGSPCRFIHRRAIEGIRSGRKGYTESNCFYKHRRGENISSLCGLHIKLLPRPALLSRELNLL